MQITALVHYDLGIESVAMILFFYFGAGHRAGSHVAESGGDGCAVGARRECEVLQLLRRVRMTRLRRRRLHPAGGFPSVLLACFAAAIAVVHSERNR